jgi:effector-binding domain-containing protein
MKKPFLFACILAIAISCGSKNPPEGSSDSLQTAPADSTTNDSTATAKEPTMQIEEGKISQQYFMVMDDSANTPEEIGKKFETIFGKVGECAAKCKMEGSGPPAAWYNGPEAPWKFTAGMPYTTKCEHPEKGISVKEIKAGNAVIVHYFGPYELMSKGYTSGEDYMKSKNLVAGGAPYEVYIGDPMTEKNPYKVQTDIVFPLK